MINQITRLKIAVISPKPLYSLKDLEFRLGESREKLRFLAENWRNEYSPFQQFKEPKPFQKEQKQSKPRNIDNPSAVLKAVQKKILEKLLKPVMLPNFLFGGVAKLSIKEHAGAHLGSSCVVKMDVKSYYPNVTSRHVYSVWHEVLGYSPSIAALLTKLTTYEWHLPQGAPTSPALANLYLASIYTPVLESCSVSAILPTTWVDDLIFSGPNARSIMEPVRRIFAEHGFKLSHKKRFVLGSHDSKVVTGIRLGAHEIRAPKDKLHDLRAAIHKLEIGMSAAEAEKQIRSVKGKLNHIRSICLRDASKLEEKFHRVLEASHYSFPK